MPWVFVNLRLYYKYEGKPCKHEKATVTSITHIFKKVFKISVEESLSSPEGGNVQEQFIISQWLLIVLAQIELEH